MNKETSLLAADADLAVELCPEPFSEILHRLERAARNGGRAHLEHAHVRAIITSSIFLLLNELKQNEMSKKWAMDEDHKLVGSSSGTIGCGIAPIAMTGLSAGSMDGPLAAGVSALAAARRIIRQTPPKKR